MLVAHLRTRVHLLLCTLALALSSCGHARTSSSRDSRTASEAAQNQRASSGDSVPIPELPQGIAPPPRERPEPNIRTLEDAQAALEQGFYPAVERALESLKSGGNESGAYLLEARLQFEKGRYDDAAQTVERASQNETLRTAAQTLKAEALMARGRLEEAEQTFRRLTTDPTAHRARVLLGRLLDQRGKRNEARSTWMQLIDAYNNESIRSNDAEGLTYVAMAAWGLESFQDANDAFQEATKANPKRVETQLEWAQMFVEKYDAGHAEESVRQVLAENPNHPFAHALLALLKIEQSFDFAAAEKEIEQAFAVNPNLILCHVLRAGMALRDLDIEEADRRIAAALTINPHDLLALSTRAAIRYLAEDTRGFAAAKKEVLRRNPVYSRLYTTIGEYAEWEHRYPEIVEMSQEALKLNEDDVVAQANLGLNLLRMGDETSGLDALHKAWERDHFNVQVYNILNLYDDVIPQQYTEVTLPERASPPLVFRLHKDERVVLEHYAVPLLENAWKRFIEQYGFTPEGQVRIELYANQEHFSVRTTGLPNLGLQGVCFGKVVTAISPKGGPFNWGQITWHELAHVFHIQLSRNRVPRWFTEGLAEYETTVARPEWKREEDHKLWLAFEGGRIPPLRLMNRAFTHARSADEMMTAYYASSQLVAYMAQRFGFPKLVEMLRQWGTGAPTDVVIQKSVGVSLDDLDRDFRLHIHSRLRERANDFTVDWNRYSDLPALRRGVQTAGDHPQKIAALAAGLLAEGDAQHAMQEAQRALRLDPNEPTANFIMARVALEKQDGKSADGHLSRILATGHDGYDIRLLRAKAIMQQPQPNASAARTELEAATRLDPQRPEAWQGLIALGERIRNGEVRLRALKELARIDQHDRETSASLLEILFAQSQWNDLQTFGEMALYLDPERSDTHRLLAESYLHTGKPNEALGELDMALATQPPKPGIVQLARAQAFLALGRRNEAQGAVDLAVGADAALRDRAQRIMNPQH